MYVKLLTEEVEIIRSKELLYDVYVKELCWFPWRTRNKSNIHVVDGIDGKMLSDDFDDRSILFGAFCDDELCGRVRVMLGELQYIELSRHINLSGMIESKEILEFNRFASVSGVRSSVLIYLLCKTIFEYSASFGAVPVCATANNSLKRLFRYIGLENLLDFKYEPVDPVKSSLFVGNNLDVSLNHLSKRLKRKRYV